MAMMHHLFYKILSAIETDKFDWSDAYIQPDLPVLLRTPGGNVPLDSELVTPEHILELANVVWEFANGTERTGLSAEAYLKKSSIREATDLVRASDDGGPEVPATRLRFIISSANCRKGYSVVVRKIPQDIPDMLAMGLPPVTKSLIGGAGLVLVTGPTGCGKSTVVASMVQEIRQSGRAGHIVIIADPLEYAHPSTNLCVVTNRQVGVDVATYAEAAEDALRMAPRVIEFGEIRDAETALAALSLGESGHLVFTTLQASTVEGAVAKLIALTAQNPGAREAILSCLKGVIRPALVPSTSHDRWQLACEFVLNEGEFKEAFAQNSNNAAAVRKLLRENTYPRFGLALNRSLEALIKANKVKEADALAASNDILPPTGSTQNRLNGVN